MGRDEAGVAGVEAVELDQAQPRAVAAAQAPCGGSRATADRLSSLDGSVTVIIDAVLTIHQTVDPQVLADKPAQVHNLGRIRCMPAQMSVLQTHMGLNDGELIDTTTPPEDNEHRRKIDNVGYLTL